MRAFLAAVQFLTIVPARGGKSVSDAALFFPAVGALVGAAAGLVFEAARMAVPAPVAAVVALAFLVVMTGGLHEDGLADVFDAFRAGRTPEKIHAILKDSRVGTFGVLALVLTLLVRWQGIAALGGRAVVALAAVVGAARGAMVVLAYVARPATEGIGGAFCRGLRGPLVAGAAVQAAALPFLCGWPAGCAAAVANGVAIVGARAYFHRHLGGITGDCLGALSVISEVVLLLILMTPWFT